MRIGKAPVQYALEIRTRQNFSKRNAWFMEVNCPRCLDASTHPVRTSDRARTVIAKGRCRHWYLVKVPGGLRWE